MPQGRPGARLPPAVTGFHRDKRHYKKDGQLGIPGQPALFHHTDQNMLARVPRQALQSVDVPDARAAGGGDMTDAIYTPGHTQNATDFMAKRTLESHGGFFVPYLRRGDCVLDCGCGPGTISLGIASMVAPGLVTGIDVAASQVHQARQQAAERNVGNAEFQPASCYALPFADASFDCIFCHALMEHLSDPGKAVREFLRVLKPGGYVGLCSPDWDGLLVAPLSEQLTEAAAAYAGLQQSNGGDLRIGHKLGRYLSDSGFQNIHMTARYECYESLAFIGEYLGFQLAQNGQPDHARTFKEWSVSPGGLFAQAWVAAVGKKPDA